MKTMLYIAAPLLIALAQPAQPPVQPTLPVASLDSHLARHPKAKVAASTRAKNSAAKSGEQTAAARNSASVSTSATPLPTVHPRAKPSKSTPPR
ncbi:MAG: hypothetical protein IPP90_14775 [Gemmatimonadaceae bacterium]|nr:hypothetical protein [Gemmatimonadaceae bacterium]